jgi:hypothetical protein
MHLMSLVLGHGSWTWTEETFRAKIEVESVSNASRISFRQKCSLVLLGSYVRYDYISSRGERRMIDQEE